MKSALLDLLSQVITLLFALLAICAEILECLRDCLVVCLGFELLKGRVAAFYVKFFMPSIMKDFRAKSKRNLIHIRIKGHIFFMCLHLYHFFDFILRLNKLLPTHPELQEVKDLTFRYLTIWNLLLQIVYSIIGLACDLSIVLKKNRIVPDWLRNYRYTMFAGLVWPVAWAVFAFWSIYLYRKELIIKPEFEPVFTTACNLDFHAAVHVYAIWELIFLPKKYPNQKDSTALVLTVVASTIYIMSIFYTKYVEPGIWVYNILDLLDGTIHIYIFIIAIFLQTILAYFTQWHIKRHLWISLSFSKNTKKT